MSETWLTIVGLGEDGPDGLSPASREALDAAEIVMGAARHLGLLAKSAAKQVEWPVPFADGVPMLLGMRGQRVVVLASGDPFWFGAGSVLARALEPGEWRAFPASSTFSLIAARLGWPLEDTLCMGLHAAPLERLRPILCAGKRAIVTVRDGGAVGALAGYLQGLGFGETQMHVCEAIGGSRERMRSVTAAEFDLADVQHPVAVALDVAGSGVSVGVVTGRADDIFDHDGQITKRPIRALTLSALAPRHGERLWDIGAGSGSIALEWLLADRSLQAIAVEERPNRADRIAANALVLGQDRLQVVTGTAPDVLIGLDAPDVVFVGGGLNKALLEWLEANLAEGARLVANAVTLETEAVLTDAQARLGGSLTKIDVSEAVPLGKYRGWKAAYPIVQWSVTL